MVLNFLNKFLGKKKNGGKKVLIIEDNKILSDMYKFKLELEGYNVLIANSGSKGLEIVNKFPPDLILLDIMMPEMNGFEVLEKFNEQKKEFKVIVFTNLNNPEDMERAKSLGAVDYVVKASLTPKELITKINIFFS